MFQMYLCFCDLYFFIMQTDKTGCTRFTIEMSTFTNIGSKVLQNQMVIKASVEEEGTGKC